MNVARSFATVAMAAGLTFAAAPAVLAVPAAFTSQGVATSYEDGKAVKVPNTLHYKKGFIRLEMQPPAAANPDGGPVFNVILAQEGSDTITMLNPQERQAMRLPASTLEEVSQNASLQKISKFNLKEFAQTFRAQGKALGTESVAGEACTVLEQKGKDGHFKLWLSNKHEIPLKFVYFENGKPAFDYEVKSFSASSSLSDSAFAVPSGYQTIDMGEMLNGNGHQ